MIRPAPDGPVVTNAGRQGSRRLGRVLPQGRVVVIVSSRKGGCPVIGRKNWHSRRRNGSFRRRSGSFRCRRRRGKLGRLSLSLGHFVGDTKVPEFVWWSVGWSQLGKRNDGAGERPPCPCPGPVFGRSRLLMLSLFQFGPGSCDPRCGLNGRGGRRLARLGPRERRSASRQTRIGRQIMQ